MKLEKKTVVLASLNGVKDQETEVEILGPLAIHRGLGLDSDLWVISHLASGGQVAKCETKTLLLKALPELAALNWEGLTARSREKLAALAGPRMEILKRHGVL